LLAQTTTLENFFVTEHSISAAEFVELFVRTIVESCKMMSEKTGYLGPIPAAAFFVKTDDTYAVHLMDLSTVDQTALWPMIVEETVQEYGAFGHALIHVGLGITRGSAKTESILACIYQSSDMKSQIGYAVVVDESNKIVGEIKKLPENSVGVMYGMPGAAADDAWN